MARLIPNTWHDTQLLDADNGRIVASAATPSERAEIARRYNAHDELVSALQRIIDMRECNDGYVGPKTIAIARAALAKLDA